MDLFISCWVRIRMVWKVSFDCCMDGIYANDMPVYSREMPLHRFHDVQTLLTILIQLLLSHPGCFEGLLPSVIRANVLLASVRTQKNKKKEEGPKFCFYWLQSIFSLTSVAPTYLLVAQVQLDKTNCPRPRWQHNDKYCDLNTPFLVNKSLVVTKHPTVLHLRCSFLGRVGKGNILFHSISIVCQTKCVIHHHVDKGAHLI